MSANTHKILYHVTRQARKPDAVPEATLTVAPPGRRVHTQGKQPINSPGFAPPIPSVQPRDFSFSEERRKSPPGWSIKSRPLPACSDCLVYPSRRLACATVNSSIFTMNSTLFSATPETYWSHFEEISKYNVHLNVFERLWVAWYAFMQNDVLATGIMSFVIHEVVYFGRCLPWIIIDSFGLFKQYKIQTNKTPSAKEQWDCAKLVLLSHFTVELPQIWLFHPMAQYFGLSTTVPFPSLWTMAYQIPIFFVMEDTWHYFSHRAFHWGPLYKTVHKIHHQYSAPFGLAAEYASPIEVMALGLGTVASPILWCAFTKDLHILTMYIWIVLRLLQAIDAHSGYEFPWSLHHFLPFWAGADHHDVHHEKFVGNYASSFRWWDYMLDTEYTPESVKRWREKKLEKAQKKAN